MRNPNNEALVEVQGVTRGAAGSVLCVIIRLVKVVLCARVWYIAEQTLDCV